MNHKLGLRIMAIAVVLALAAMPAWAGGGPGRSGVEITGGQISFSAEAATAGGTLTLRGPDGFKQVHRFAPGQAPVAQLMDEGGAVLADGMYRFHLKPDTIDQNSRPHFGVFFVQDGQAVSRAGKRQALAERRGELAGAAPVGPMTRAGGADSPLQTPGGEGFAASDYIDIVDTAMDGNTFLTLYSNYGGGGGPTFDLRNNGFAAFIGYPAGYGYYGSYAGVNVVGNVFMGSPGYKLIVSSAAYGLAYPLTVAPYAPSYSLWLAPTGVGVGTTYANAPLHVIGSSAFGANTMQVERADGTTPNIRFRTSGGAVTQNWLFQNNANSGVFAIRDETNGNSAFRLFPGVPEGALQLNANGSFNTSTGASLTAGGVWQNASSRTLKTAIEELSSAAALTALTDLKPVRFEYKKEPGDTKLGFIAEDVPDLVASADRKSLSPMDIVAVLTRVVQEQQATNEALEKRVAHLEELLESSD